MTAPIWLWKAKVAANMTAAISPIEPISAGARLRSAQRAAEQVADDEPAAEDEQDRRDGRLAEAGELHQDRLDEGEDREDAAEAEHGHDEAELDLRPRQHP